MFENQFEKQGMKMEIQRKMPDGSYVPASESQVGQSRRGRIYRPSQRLFSLCHSPSHTFSHVLLYSMHQVDALKTRARMTTFAEALKHMSLEEKTACALDMKNAANQLYDDQEYAEATQCYLQVQ